MEVFAVSFVVFALVAGLLVLVQQLGGGRLPVGCRPESGVCCRAGESREPSAEAFGNSIGSGGPERGRVGVWHPESGR